MCHKHSPSPNPRPDPQTDPQNGPKWGVSGDPKKGAKLSRLGELLNTQKNVHFLRTREPPPGGVAPGTPKCTQFWTHSGGHQILIIVVQGIPRTPFLGPILARFSAQFSAHFGARAPGRPGAGFSGFSGFPEFPDFRPGRDQAPEPPSRGGVAGGSPGTDLARCSRSYNHSTASSTPAVAVRPSYGRVSQA